MGLEAGRLLNARKPWLLLPLLALGLIGLAWLPALAKANAGQDDVGLIRSWKLQWIADRDSSRLPPSGGSWLDGGAGRAKTKLPPGDVGAWIRLTVPATSRWQHPALLVDRLYGTDIAVFEDGRLLYESKRGFAFDRNKLLLPLDSSPDERELYVLVRTTGDRVGWPFPVRVGDLNDLSVRFVAKDLPDVLLGASIAFLAFIMLLCSGYLHRRLRGGWISLCLIALSMGTLILAYSPLPYVYFGRFGGVLLFLFDLSLLTLPPALNAFAARIFEGRFPIFTRFRRMLDVYCAACFAVLLLNVAASDRLRSAYFAMSVYALGALIAAQLLLIAWLSIRDARGGRRDSATLAVGAVTCSAAGIADLALYLLSDRAHVFVFWKYGFLALTVSLVVILARRISADYGQLVNYSRELELYNRTLQRTEKLKVISDLAASVAHEVRNPLQVTRGFLQLLAGRTDPQSRAYYELAVSELDRAAGIITDFLTFAKPELEEIDRLEMQEELKKVEAMITPLAVMNGAMISFEAEKGLYFRGNSSKLKQALLNIVKNGIEAIGTDGWIQVKAEAEDDDIVVRISDNGVGMEPEELTHLGVPFFSMKAKGTGLGLMVTFRIVEAMGGSIRFASSKGKGTDVVVRFPRLTLNAIVPEGPPSPEDDD